jgi:hypothetical protein
MTGAGKVCPDGAIAERRWSMSALAAESMLGPHAANARSPIEAKNARRKTGVFMRRILPARGNAV